MIPVIVVCIYLGIIAVIGSIAFRRSVADLRIRRNQRDLEGSVPAR